MKRSTIYFLALSLLFAITLHSCSRGTTTVRHTAGHYDKLAFITLKAELSDSGLVISPVSIFWSDHMMKDREGVTVTGDRWTMTFLDDQNQVLKSLQINNPLKQEHEVYSPAGPMKRKT